MVDRLSMKSHGIEALQFDPDQKGCLTDRIGIGSAEIGIELECLPHSQVAGAGFQQAIPHAAAERLGKERDHAMGEIFTRTGNFHERYIDGVERCARHDAGNEPGGFFLVCGDAGFHRWSVSRSVYHQGTKAPR